MRRRCAPAHSTTAPSLAARTVSGCFGGRMADPPEAPACSAELAVAEAVDQAAVRRFVGQVVRCQLRRLDLEPAVLLPVAAPAPDVWDVQGGVAGQAVPARGRVAQRGLRLHPDPASAACRQARFVSVGPWGAVVRLDSFRWRR